MGKSINYNNVHQLTPKERLEYYRHMAKFWKAAGDKSTASNYDNKAKELEKRMEKPEVLA